MQLCSKSNCNKGSAKNPEELSGRGAEGPGRGCSSVLMGIREKCPHLWRELSDEAAGGP